MNTLIDRVTELQKNVNLVAENRAMTLEELTHRLTQVVDILSDLIAKQPAKLTLSDFQAEITNFGFREALDSAIIDHLELRGWNNWEEKELLTGNRIDDNDAPATIDSEESDDEPFDRKAFYRQHPQWAVLLNVSIDDEDEDEDVDPDDDGDRAYDSWKDDGRFND